MHNTDDEQLFSDEQIQRFDAETIKHRFGDNWRNYASNVREVKQADGSIVRGKYAFVFRRFVFLVRQFRIYHRRSEFTARNQAGNRFDIVNNRFRRRTTDLEE